MIYYRKTLFGRGPKLTAVQYELMCTFFFNCHTYTLASDTKLEQPDWRKNRGQFSQKKVWQIVEEYGEIVGMNGGVSVT